MRGPADPECVEILRALLRFRTVNPPGDELPAASWVADVLRSEGIPAEVLEPEPGRGSVVGRLRGDGTLGEPLLLLSHLDVVPAPIEGWLHDPFGAEIVDGQIWGRGALDMKSITAIELAVMLRLARRARRLGRDPASDPVPGLGRDVILAATADEEAGGRRGLGWIVDHRPELVMAAGAVNEPNSVTLWHGRRRIHPVAVAEKGLAWYRATVSGTWGHGAMPNGDNAIETAARVVTALAGSVEPTVVPSVQALLDTVADRLGEADAERLRSVILADGDLPGCGGTLAGALRAIGRTTISVDTLTAGVGVNVIPGEARLEIDCRPFPGVDPTDVEGLFRDRLGEDLWGRVTWEPIAASPGLEHPLDHPLLEAYRETLAVHDPGAVMVPTLVPFITDAKHLARLGVPTYGMATLRVERGEPYLELLHGDNERVGLDSVAFGLRMMDDLVWRYAGVAGGRHVPDPSDLDRPPT